MKTSQLLLSGLDITEDGYNFKAQFILNAPGKTKCVDIGELESDTRLEEIKSFFDLEETTIEVKNQIMAMVIEKAHIGSNIIEGENYEETSKKKGTEHLARTLDMA